MNKISLKNLNLKEVEQLSREQLKGVLGGFTGGTGGTGTETQTQKNVVIPCSCDDGRQTNVICDSTEECTEACITFCESDPNN